MYTYMHMQNTCLFAMLLCQAAVLTSQECESFKYCMAQRAAENGKTLFLEGQDKDK
jgi:hypothetical protein